MRSKISCIMYRVSCIMVVLTLVGCVTARKVTRERVDQEVAGNQGVIYGKTPAPTRPEKTTREYVQVDVDVTEMFAKKEKPAEAKPAPVTEAAPAPQPLAEAKAPMAPLPAEVRTYTVKPDQSLSRIAKEVYGDGSKWNIIYEANKDMLKDPNRIKAGMVLVIPEIGAPKKAEK